jgi:hypothetical protein
MFGDDYAEAPQGLGQSLLPAVAIAGHSPGHFARIDDPYIRNGKSRT